MNCIGATAVHIRPPQPYVKTSGKGMKVGLTGLSPAFQFWPVKYVLAPLPTPHLNQCC